ncbi:MAG: hypothetical protein IPK01_08430 [Acidobacteria bacterium]|nr:hypothetical protein [Acidobacteriota bacterium]
MPWKTSPAFASSGNSISTRRRPVIGGAPKKDLKYACVDYFKVFFRVT